MILLRQPQSHIGVWVPHDPRRTNPVRDTDSTRLRSQSTLGEAESLAMNTAAKHTLYQRMNATWIKQQRINTITFRRRGGMYDRSSGELQEVNEAHHSQDGPPNVSIVTRRDDGRVDTWRKVIGRYAYGELLVSSRTMPDGGHKRRRNDGDHPRHVCVVEQVIDRRNFVEYREMLYS